MSHISVRAFVEREATSPVNIRLPHRFRERAKEIAKSESLSGIKVNETDVYRYAIALFLGRDFTDSKVQLTHDAGTSFPIDTNSNAIAASIQDDQ
jgi:hypothetical protein